MLYKVITYKKITFVQITTQITINKSKGQLYLRRVNFKRFHSN